MLGIMTEMVSKTGQGSESGSKNKQTDEERKKLSLPDLYKRAAEGKPITWVTGYDFSTAYLQEQAGIDMILVGDSLGMTMLGYPGTLPVTMDDMIRHTAAVRRGAPNTFVIGDMPYMSYQPSVETAVRNAGRFMAETGCDAIKLEGGVEMADRVSAIVKAGIPTIGHLGLTPQSAAALGGFRLQGKGAEQAARIIESARVLEEAGAFMILLELVPDRVCKLIKESANKSIIMSLVSGPYSHGQLLIFHDMFGLYPKFKPRMAKVYGNAGEVIVNGLKQYVEEVTSNTFPERSNYFTMPDEEYDKLLKELNRKQSASNSPK